MCEPSFVALFVNLEVLLRWGSPPRALLFLMFVLGFCPEKPKLFQATSQLSRPLWPDSESPPGHLAPCMVTQPQEPLHHSPGDLRGQATQLNPVH